MAGCSNRFASRPFCSIHAIFVLCQSQNFLNMQFDKETCHVTKASEHLFLELGFQPSDAALLMATSDNQLTDAIAHKLRAADTQAPSSGLKAVGEGLPDSPSTLANLSQLKNPADTRFHKLRRERIFFRMRFNFAKPKFLFGLSLSKPCSRRRGTSFDRLRAVGNTSSVQTGSFLYRLVPKS